MHSQQHIKKKKITYMFCVEVAIIKFHQHIKGCHVCYYHTCNIMVSSHNRHIQLYHIYLLLYFYIKLDDDPFSLKHIVYC